MARYPTREVVTKGEVDKQSGGSISYIKRVPDFKEFSEDDWKVFNLEKLHKENAKLKGWLSLLIMSLVVIALYYFGDM